MTTHGEVAKAGGGRGVCGWWYRERVQSQPCCQPGRATGRGARGEWQVRDKVNNTTHTHTPAHTRTPLRGPDSRKRRAKDQADARGGQRESAVEGDEAVSCAGYRPWLAGRTGGVSHDRAGAVGSTVMVGVP
jgi:hypothetical protein